MLANRTVFENSKDYRNNLQVKRGTINCWVVMVTIGNSSETTSYIDDD